MNEKNKRRKIRNEYINRLDNNEYLLEEKEYKESRYIIREWDNEKEKFVYKEELINHKLEWENELAVNQESILNEITKGLLKWH